MSPRYNMEKFAGQPIDTLADSRRCENHLHPSTQIEMPKFSFFHQFDTDRKICDILQLGVCFVNSS